jgi:hypothetical protein
MLVERGSDRGDPGDVMTVSAIEYGAAWFRAFLHQAGGVPFENEQAAHIARLAERKLVDLFDAAEGVAIANGRGRILRHDLPITKGLRGLLGEADALAHSLELQPLLLFLADAGVPAPLDEEVRAEVPRIMAGLLLLSARVVALLTPASMSTDERLERLLRHVPRGPTHWELERATRILDMTL